MANNIPPLLAAVRLLGYALGIGVSLALAGQLVATEHRLSHALGGLLVGWAFNGGLLVSLLLFNMVTGDDRPGWRDTALTVNAVVVGAAPVILWWALNRWGDSDR